MKLKDLLAGIEVLASTADPETEIPGVCYDSRKVQPGELFVAVTGYATDGHAYIGKAKAAGGRWPSWGRTSTAIPPGR